MIVNVDNSKVRVGSSKANRSQSSEVFLLDGF